jgi:predicted chitinase
MKLSARVLVVCIFAFAVLAINLFYFTTRTNISFALRKARTHISSEDETPVDRRIELAIGILSAPRPHDADYVYRTVAAIDREINLTPIARNFVKKVLVFSPRAVDEHIIYKQTEKRFSGDSLYHFVARDVTNKTALAIKGHPGKWRTMRGRDIQQNIDASALFAEVHEQFCKHKPRGYMMLMEDDFEMCPWALNHLYRAISAAEFQYFSNFTAIRVSYGFNGMILHCTDVKKVSEYLFENKQEGPTDAMTSPWWTKYLPEGKAYFGDRKHCAYRHNLLEHIGDHSAVWGHKSTQKGRFPQCYDDLYFNGMSHEDWFDFRRCRGKEFSPCDAKDMGNSMLTSFRGNPEFDPAFKPDTLVSDIKVMNGSQGESCSEACARVGLECALFAMPLINQCATLKKYFPCSDCVAHNFISRNAISRSPMIDTKDRICYESHIVAEMKCDGKGEEMIRLCTCYKKMEVPWPVCINEDDTKVRKGPCTTFSVVEKLQKHTFVEPTGHNIDGCDKSWIEIGKNRYVEASTISKCPNAGVSAQDLEGMVPEIKQDQAKKILPYLNAAMLEGEINTCMRKAAFMGQISHETGGLQGFVSSMSEGDFDETYGNKEHGDGTKYKGRGPLQMRGRKNYVEIGKLIGVDLENEPDLAAQNHTMYRVAAMFWKKHGLNELADKGDSESYDKITYAINLGDHGKGDRDYRFTLAQRALDCN